MKQRRSEEEDQKTVREREAEKVENDKGEKDRGRTIERAIVLWGKNLGKKIEGKGGEKYSVARSFCCFFLSSAASDR